MDNHYTPGQIRFSREQVLWLLKWSEVIKSGVWPSDYKVSGYVGKGKSHNQRAAFENPISIWAELSVRLDRCNQDGYYALQVYSGEDQLVEMERISKAFNMDINEVSDRCEKALKFCTGWCRRWQKCSSCRVKDCPRRGKKRAYEYRAYRY